MGNRWADCGRATRLGRGGYGARGKCMPRDHPRPGFALLQLALPLLTIVFTLVGVGAGGAQLGF